jgi:hypothetical protein
MNYLFERDSVRVRIGVRVRVRVGARDRVKVRVFMRGDRSKVYLFIPFLSLSPFFSFI